MPTRIQSLIAAWCCCGLTAAAHAQGRSEPPTSCMAVAVLSRAADTLWLRDSLPGFDARIAAVLPRPARTTMRLDVGKGDFAGAMRTIATAAEAAFDAAGPATLPAGFRQTFKQNADSAEAILRQLASVSGDERTPLLTALRADRFRETSRLMPATGEATTFFFATTSAGVRIDPDTLPRGTFEAACWSLVSADLLLLAYTAPLLATTSRRLDELLHAWKNFSDYRRPETVLEWGVNHLRWKHSPSLGPPTKQWILLHPIAAVVVNGLGSGSERRPAYGMEVVGLIQYPIAWNWKHYVGFSGVMVGTQTGPLHYGGYFHLSRYGSAGIVTRKFEGKQRVAFVTSVDLARFFWKDDKDLAEFAAMQQQKAKGEQILSATVEKKKAQ